MLGLNLLNEEPALGAIRTWHLQGMGLFDTLCDKLEDGTMASQLCQKCKQAHPGRVCDFDEKGECAETIDLSVAQPCSEPPSKDNEKMGSVESEQLSGGFRRLRL